MDTFSLISILELEEEKNTNAVTFLEAHKSVFIVTEYNNLYIQSIHLDFGKILIEKKIEKTKDIQIKLKDM